MAQKSKRIKFSDMLTALEQQVDALSEHRAGKNISYTLKTAILSAFSVFYMQSASFLAYQRLVKQQRGDHNVRTLFGVSKIPSDQQIRNLLDAVAPEKLSGVFGVLLAVCAGRGHLKDFRVLEGQQLCALDGTRYFYSTKIHCPNCSTQEVSSDRVGYAHCAVIPVVAAPGKSQVLALAPAFVQPQDGQEKQDCEVNAAKRWLQRHGPEYSPWKMILLGDDLYCHQPFCQAVLAEKFDFILVCKPDSHVALYEWVAAMNQGRRFPAVSKRHWNGRHGEIWTCRYLNELPLRRGDDVLLVNWCELTVAHEETGERLYQNAFATNLPLSPTGVMDIVQAGRARWKVENEGNDVLKTRGYHLEHNFGHGQQYLAATLLQLNLLAFLFHTLLELADWKYQMLRSELGARYIFFNDLQALFRYMLHEGWEHLLDFMLERLELARPP